MAADSAIIPDNKRGAGRPAFVPTDEQRRDVIALCKYGIPQEDIALYLDIDVKTLTKHFGRELAIAAAKANMKVSRTLFKKACQGDVTACIWWTKARMRWREDRGPLVNIDQRNVTEVSDEQLLEAIHAETAKRLGK